MQQGGNEGCTTPSFASGVLKQGNPVYGICPHKMLAKMIFWIS